MKHPFKKGQRVRCVRASEWGIPIAEGEEYIVSKAFVGHQDGSSGDGPIPGMENIPGICVENVVGWFTADRFMEIENEQ